MNERIRELIEEATMITEVWNDEVGTKRYYQLNEEKFAELLVRDTLDQVAEFARLSKVYLAQGIDPGIDVTKEVLKNFGFTRFGVK